MSDVAEFVGRAHAFCVRSGLSPATVSRKLLGNGIRLGELEQGKSLRVDTLVRAQAALAQMETDLLQVRS